MMTILALVTVLAAGVILLAALGAARRNGPSGAGRNRTLRFWPELARALTGDGSLDEVLLQAASALRRWTGASAAHVFKISGDRSHLRRVGTVAASGRGAFTFDADTDGLPLRDLVRRAAEGDGLLCTDGSNGAAYQVAVPLHANGRVPAAVVLDGPRIDFEDTEVAEAVQAAAVMVGQTIAAWCESTTGVTHGRLSKNLRTALPGLLRADRLERGLPAILAAVEGVIDVDYISVAWLGESRSHEDRVSMVAGDGRIVESRRRWPIGDGTTLRVLKVGRALITPDLEAVAGDEVREGDSWERRLGMRSRLVLPVVDKDRVIGTLTVAHRQSARYTELDSRLLAVVGDVLSLWFHGLAATRMVRRFQEVGEIVNRFQNGNARWDDEQAILAEAGHLLNVTGLRLYRRGGETPHLEEVATAGRLDPPSPPRRIPLDRLPWHRWALDSGRSLRVHQGDPEALMTDDEAALTMHRGFKTGCVIPIRHDHTDLGILDAVEMRDPDRTSLDEVDQAVLEALAAAVARHWTHGWSSSGEHGRIAGDASTFPDGDRTAVGTARELNRDIASPLTAVIGSVELIRLRQPHLNTGTVKYLNIIERSAGRIQEIAARYMAACSGARAGNVVSPLSDSTSPIAPAFRVPVDGRDTSMVDDVTSRPAFARPASIRVRNHSVPSCETQTDTGNSNGSSGHTLATPPTLHG